jgi:hypothetical protein
MLTRLRRTKATYSSSHADYKTKINAAILWDMGHIKGRLCKGRIEQGKETKNFNVVDVHTIQESIYKFQTVWVPPWEAD